MFSASPYTVSKALRSKFLAALLALGLPLMAVAQSENSNQPSDDGAEAIQNLAKLFEVSNYSQALTDVKKVKAKFDPNSYDYAYLSQMEALAYINLKDIAGCVPALETALNLAEKFGYFQPAQRLELISTIGQVYAQLAGEAKTVELQKAYWDKSYNYALAWIKKSPKKTQDGEYNAAQALYYKAAVGGADNLDPVAMKGVQDHCEKALRLAVKPKEHAMLLLVASLQQQKELARSAEVLELMVQYFPNSKNYWAQLSSTYIILSETKKEGSPERTADLIKAIVSYERAQKLGILVTPKDYYTLVGLLINTQQQDGAIDLLEAGLADGRLEPEQKNWQLLAQSYQEIKKDLKAIETFKKAIKLYPKDGSLDLQVANIYYALDKLEDALKYLKTGYAKGVEKPAATQVFIAYLSLELKKLEDAKAAATKALELDPKNKDAARLLEGANSEIQEREQILKTKSTKA